VVEAERRRRDERSTRDGGIHRKIQRIDVMIPNPSSSPTSGDRKMKTIVLVHPLRMIAAKPAFATPAPA
jgi:hypothetical protein